VIFNESYSSAKPISLFKLIFLYLFSTNNFQAHTPTPNPTVAQSNHVCCSQPLLPVTHPNRRAPQQQIFPRFQVSPRSALVVTAPAAWRSPDLLMLLSDTCDCVMSRRLPSGEEPVWVSQRTRALETRNVARSGDCMRESKRAWQTECIDRQVRGESISEAGREMRVRGERR